MGVPELPQEQLQGLVEAEGIEALGVVDVFSIVDPLLGGVNFIFHLKPSILSLSRLAAAK